MSYNAIRHFVDSWGLVAMAGIFLTLCLWPLLPGSRASASRAAMSILEDEDRRHD